MSFLTIFLMTVLITGNRVQALPGETTTATVIIYYTKTGSYLKDAGDEPDHNGHGKLVAVPFGKILSNRDLESLYWEVTKKDDTWQFQNKVTKRYLNVDRDHCFTTKSDTDDDKWETEPAGPDDGNFYANFHSANGLYCMVIKDNEDHLTLKVNGEVHAYNKIMLVPEPDKAGTPLLFDMAKRGGGEQGSMTMQAMVVTSAMMFTVAIMLTCAFNACFCYVLNSSSGFSVRKSGHITYSKV